MLSSSRLALLSAAALPLLSSLPQVTAQAKCLSLQGSTACPSFQDAYINPSNLSNAWPWMSEVTDVASFDIQANLYFSDPNRFHATKLNNQLECNERAAKNTALQWQKTILCGQWSQISYSAQCNVENRAVSIMVCQDTCTAYSDTQKAIVDNPQICAADDDLTEAQRRTRSQTLLDDYTDCTDWTTLVSTNNATCVEGIENEGNCGWGPEVSDQLCAFCDPTGNNKVDACCYDKKTDLSQCSDFGHPGAALVRATMSIPPQIGASSTAPAASGTGLSDSSNTSNKDDAGLTNGQLAGAIVGSILGALLLGALLTLFLMKRRGNREADAEASELSKNGGVYAGVAPGAAASNEKGWNHSSESQRGASPNLMQEKSGSHSKSGAAAGAVGGAGIGAAAMAASGSPQSQSRPLSSLSASSGTDGRGTTVPLVRDQYSGHDILPGESVIAIYPYNASLNDELTLELEDRITVARLYDDGWALGTNPTSGEQGAFPLVCVTSEKGDAPMSRAGGNGTSVTGTSGTDDGMTSGNDAFTSDAEGAVTADEGYASASSRRH